MSTSPNDRPQAPLGFILKNPSLTSYILFGISALLAVLPVWLAIRYGWDYAVVVALTACLPLIGLGAGLYLLVTEPAQLQEPAAARIWVLTVGGLLGLALTAIGVSLGKVWWNEYLFPWLSGEEGKEIWRLVVVALLGFGGLGLMFASLQLGRTEERTNATLRRLLYGYNTVLTGLLLLAVLAVANLLVALKMPQYVDFTASNIYSLSSRSVNMLQGLDKPVEVYVVLSNRGEHTWLIKEMRTLLENFQENSDKITWKIVSPDLSRAEVQDLVNRFPTIGREGILVVYDPDAKADHRFIKAEDLYDQDRSFGAGSGEKPSLKFKGEDALMTEISSLSEGSEKPVIYFTQGNGEPDLKNTEASPDVKGIGLLKQSLEERNFEVKPLTLGPGQEKVPDDASVVVIIQPTLTLPDATLKALREYMNPTGEGRQPGKLMVLLGPPSFRAADQKTGLEDFLTEFNVQVGQDRVLALSGVTPAGPTAVQVGLNRGLGDNPLVKAFQDYIFWFIDTQSVRPTVAPRSPQLQAAPLALAPAGQYLLIQTDLKEPWGDFLRAFAKLDGREQNSRLSQQDIPVATIVTEADTSDPHAFMRGPAAGKPRLVVFGSSSRVNNFYMASGASGGGLFDLFASSLDWLRERPSSIGVDAKEREFFTLQPDAPIGYMAWMPSLLMLVGIVGLGAGVWIVRRR